jgi:hypothetical protein
MENPMPNPYVILRGENTTVFCVQCDTEYLLPVSTEQVLRWQKGELIQNAMPELPRADRELILSGICRECWLKTFGPPPIGQAASEEFMEDLEDLPPQDREG